jgi:hypothetical protein
MAHTQTDGKRGWVLRTWRTRRRGFLRACETSVIGSGGEADGKSIWGSEEAADDAGAGCLGVEAKVV